MHMSIVVAAGTSAPIYIGGAAIALLLVAAAVIVLRRRSADRVASTRTPQPGGPITNGASQVHVPGVIHNRLRSFAQEIDRLPTERPHEGIMAQRLAEAPRVHTPEPPRVSVAQPADTVLAATHAAPPEESRFVSAAASDDRAAAPDAQTETIAYSDDSRFSTGPLAPLPPRSGR